MSFKISRIAASQLIADERLYLAADRVTVVGDGDKRAAFLLCGKGQVIPPNEVVRLKLTETPVAKEEAAVEVSHRSTRPLKASHRD